MRKKIIMSLPYSIIAGLILTLLLMGQMKFVFTNNCASYDSRFSNIRRVDCSDLRYGYPVKFIQSEGHVDVNTFDAAKNSPILLGQSSVVRFRPLNFILDAAIWSAVSLVVLVLIANRYQPRHKN